MRPVCVFVLAISALLLGPALGGDRAASFTQLARLSPVTAQALLYDAAYECGMFDGKFSCRYVPGGPLRGKSAPTGHVEKPRDSSGDSSGGDGALAPADPAGASGACRNGMVGTPPNCRCPNNSELLGGNCVRYTASTCSNGLASDALPQACRGVEEKLSCKLRDDGLKDCCCVTYDKF
jgi:hypothetical protein